MLNVETHTLHQICTSLKFVQTLVVVSHGHLPRIYLVEMMKYILCCPNTSYCGVDKKPVRTAQQTIIDFTFDKTGFNETRLRKSFSSVLSWLLHTVINFTKSLNYMILYAYIQKKRIYIPTNIYKYIYLYIYV